jgi:hypothetical protein
MSDELFEKGKKNPDNYRKLCEPFESMAAVEKAITAFWEEFYELRNKHKIPDVLVVWRVPAYDAEGEEGIVTSKLYCGNSDHAEGMAAMAYGQCAVERQERTAKHLQGFVSQKKDRR